MTNLSLNLPFAEKRALKECLLVSGELRCTSAGCIAKTPPRLCLRTIGGLDFWAEKQQAVYRAMRCTDRNLFAKSFSETRKKFELRVGGRKDDEGPVMRLSRFYHSTEE